MGLAEVRKAGGSTIVLDPRDAKYVRMPHAAMAQDGHRILRFEEITPELRRLVAAMTGNGAAAVAP
jgi:chemotaxis response regulator CheB